MLDLCCLLADDDQTTSDRGGSGQALRSEKAWQIADERVQRRGGLATRPRIHLGAAAPAPAGWSNFAAPADQTGSSRAPPKSCTCSCPRSRGPSPRRAGDIIDPEAPRPQCQEAARGAGAFYASVLPTLAPAEARSRRVRRLRPAREPRTLRRAGPPQAARSPTFYAWVAGRESGTQATPLPIPIVDQGAELFAMSASFVGGRAMSQSPPTPRGVELDRLFCEKLPGTGSTPWVFFGRSAQQPDDHDVQWPRRYLLAGTTQLRSRHPATVTGRRLVLHLETRPLHRPRHPPPPPPPLQPPAVPPSPSTHAWILASWLPLASHPLYERPARVAHCSRNLPRASDGTAAACTLDLVRFTGLLPPLRHIPSSGPRLGSWSRGYRIRWSDP